MSTEHTFVIPLVATHPAGSTYHQSHWTEQIRCPACKRSCWAPGGYAEAAKSGTKIACEECNVRPYHKLRGETLS